MAMQETASIVYFLGAEKYMHCMHKPDVISIAFWHCIHPCY